MTATPQQISRNCSSLKMARHPIRAEQERRHLVKLDPDQIRLNLGIGSQRPIDDIPLRMCRRQLLGDPTCPQRFVDLTVILRQAGSTPGCLP
jgi:hypothetical protein